VAGYQKTQISHLSWSPK